MRLHRGVQGIHPDLARQPVGLTGIARRARGDDVRPLVRPAARERDEVVARECFAGLELEAGAPAILAAIPVTREEKGVRDLPSESARDVT